MITKSIQKISKIVKLNPICSMALHMRLPPIANINKDSESFLIYHSKEYPSLEAKINEGNQFYDSVLHSDMKKKYFELIPFFMEAKFSFRKHYVIKLEVLPSYKLLIITTLSPTGIQTIHLPTNYLIPITSHDYWNAHPFLCKPGVFFDLEMIYANVGVSEMYVFDKFGKWFREGIDHQAVSLESTFNESDWYDMWNPNKYTFL